MYRHPSLNTVNTLSPHACVKKIDQIDIDFKTEKPFKHADTCGQHSEHPSILQSLSWVSALKASVLTVSHPIQ